MNKNETKTETQAEAQTNTETRKQRVLLTIKSRIPKASAPKRCA